MDNTQEAVITLENVEVWYDDLQALRGVSCSIAPGTVGLLGPNGAGKSTLIKTLLGFNRASVGTVTVYGHTVPREALAARRFLGYMPERESVSPKVSAVSFLNYCGRLFGMSRVDAMERTHEVLNYVGLGESRYRPMETYSTGMLQRVKLAQALVHDPKLLLLDEPTNGLDPKGRIEMLELIREIVAERDVTVLLSSHLLPDVEHVCDRVLVISGGKVMREGTIRELTAARDNSYEVRLRNNTAEFIEKATEAGLSCTDMRNGSVLVANLRDGGRPVFELARAVDTQVRLFQPARTNLAEAFLEALGEE